MLTNKNSKIVFLHFNDYLNRQLRPTERETHTIILEGEYSLLELKRNDWSYFIGKILQMLEKEIFELGDGDETDLENEIMLDIIDNLQVCKYFFNTLYKSPATNLCEIIVNSLFYFIKSILQDITLNGCDVLDISESGSRE